jgi:RNA polymerase sigma-70 factor (ECF subfamily)
MQPITEPAHADPGPDPDSAMGAGASAPGFITDGAVQNLSALLRCAAEGDEEAWRRLIGIYGQRVFALVRSRVRRTDLAEEVTQSVFVTVASKLKSGGYTEQGRFEPWLFRVAINRTRDELRRQRRHAEPTDPDVLAESTRDPSGDTPGTFAQRTQTESDLSALRRAMESLSESDREIIELRHHAGLAFAQIVELTGEPLGTLLARHHRALKKIRQSLEHEPPDSSSTPEPPR